MSDKLLIGRAEWFALPQLKVAAIKAKIDTGAKTSAIHAFNIRTKEHNGVSLVLFDIHPQQNNHEHVVHCQAELIDTRVVMSSNGQKETRYVIKTELALAEQRWQAELTLSNREPLRYRMLIGREALKGRVVVDPDLNCTQGKPK